ncbi:MAG: hypothetical protein IPH80_28535 [Myxococcales bacterium]|nr:hypothetical protein [Myxococcales bacterium]
MTPLGLVLLFLAGGAAPLLAWRRTTGERLIVRFCWPTAAVVVTMGLLGALVPASRALTQCSTTRSGCVCRCSRSACAASCSAASSGYIRGLGARASRPAPDPFTSLVGLVLIKRRKYGGYVVHLAIAVLFIGFAGKTWDTVVDRTIAKPAVRLAAAKTASRRVAVHRARLPSSTRPSSRSPTTTRSRPTPTSPCRAARRSSS